jgi:methylthioribose-1-phosphate isomerase
MIDTIRWKPGCVELIDQTLLPGEVVYKECRDVEVLAEAIESLRVRGAPAIGVAAAFGVALGAHEIRAGNRKTFLEELERKIQRLAATRPTAVNLFWALDRMRNVIEAFRSENVDELKGRLLEEALRIQEEDKTICRKMGFNGAELLEDGMTVLTHCNAGGLATADFGTALGVIYAAQEQGKRIRVFADETRPLLQGARLTAWELMKNGVDTTLICDNMAAWVMSRAMVDCVIVGSDRIASNGDVANKIGTYGTAISAKAHGIPFYVVAPFSTIDMKLAHGKDIPIEERKPEEVTVLAGRRIAPESVRVYNPAFDVTPHAYVTAIVSEMGIAREPYHETFRQWERAASLAGSAPALEPARTRA